MSYPLAKIAFRQVQCTTSSLRMSIFSFKIFAVLLTMTDDLINREMGRDFIDIGDYISKYLFFNNIIQFKSYIL